MPSKKRDPLRQAVLAPRIRPPTPDSVKLECGCTERTIDKYFRCPTCGHRRCPGHRALHDAQACAAST